MKKMQEICLPEIIINPHCHGRDLDHDYKTTVLQTLLEALSSLISISVFMPNTEPSITTLETLDIYIGLMRKAKEVLGITRPQYLYFGMTDDNLGECEIALGYSEVIGLKDYPLGKDGKTATTGTTGVSDRNVRRVGMQMVRSAGKVYARHCDNPEIIVREGNSIDAEVADVEDLISLGFEVPGVKIIDCHVSCRKSAEVVLNAQRKGLPIMLELCAHYLWFDADGTNWNPGLDPVFYKCFNSLRSGEDREFLVSLLKTDNPMIMISSDNAPHTASEKLTKKLGGIPSDKEMVPVICTLSKKHAISDHRVAELLSWNVGKFLGIETSKVLRSYRLVEKTDDLTYNHGIVTNPWNGSKLLFPINS